jgi:SAM-dependent methyltransferase
MPTLEIPANFPLKHFLRDVSPNDAMFNVAHSSEHYIGVGLSALNIFEYAIAQDFMRPENLQNILDLPCGHGRISRVLRSRFPDAALTVCDIDRDGVDFCVSHLNARGVYSVEDFDILKLGELYDLIWVGSLITHLNHVDTVKLIRCMERHLSHNGLLIITNNGKFVADYSAAAAPEFVEQYNAIGYGYYDSGFKGSIISRHWLEGLFAGESCGIISYLERGWDSHQDVLLAKKILR